MNEIEGLDFMSPNERERYIQQQLAETRKRRIIEARKAYTQFTKSNQEQFAKQKRAHDAKKAKAMSEEERAKLQAKISALQLRLDAAHQGLGEGQRKAQDMALQEQEERNAQKVKRAEQEIVEAQRFAEAMTVVKENDPRLPLKRRAERMKTAKDTATAKENQNLQNYAKVQKQREEEERAQKEAEKQEEYDRYHPKLYLEDFARTFYHAEVGLLPVNHEAVAYQEKIKNAEQEAVEQKKQEKEHLKERTAVAAHRHKVAKDTEMLEKELATIKQIEVNTELTSLRQEPQKEHPTAAAYLMDERERKRQARIQRFLALSDEAPKPRGPAPQPQPMHMMTTSPMPSSDDDDDSCE